MHIPSLEEELEQIVADAGNVVDWSDHVKQQVRKAIDRLKDVDRLVEEERANAVRLCEELSREYLAKGDAVGWKLNATGALEAADRIRSGRRATPPTDPAPASEENP